MKRKFLIILLVLVLTLTLVCAASCIVNIDESLKKINMGFLKDYSQIYLAVETKFDGVVLNATYTLTKTNGLTTISYQIDRLNGFENGTAPSQFISTLQGSVVYDGNKVVSVDGDAVSYDEVIETVNVMLVMRTSYFSNVKIEDNSFEADVIKPQALLNDADFAGTDVKIKVIHNDTVLRTINLSYVLDGTEVSLQYLFTL